MLIGVRYPGTGYVTQTMTRAVLFDIDGTLIDSNDQHARAWAAALHEAGYEVPFERIRPLIGMGADRLLPALVPSLSAEHGPGKAIAERRGAIFEARELASIRPQPGARALLAAVRERAGLVVIATSAKQGELGALLARGELGPLVDDAATGDDARSSKPAPDIVSIALEKAGVRADQAVFIGDTRWDVEAAHRAQVACVALCCGGNDAATLSQADALYADPAELTGALDRAPFVWSRAASTAP